MNVFYMSKNHRWISWMYFTCRNHRWISWFKMSKVRKSISWRFMSWMRSLDVLKHEWRFLDVLNRECVLHEWRFLDVLNCEWKINDDLIHEWWSLDVLCHEWLNRWRFKSWMCFTWMKIPRRFKLWMKNKWWLNSWMMISRRFMSWMIESVMF